MKIIACQECKRQWDVSRYRVGQKLRCVCNFVMEVPRVQSYTPEVHHCESCGAARAPASREPCPYCGAVPTLDASQLSLVCPFCMHRTAKGSRFCSTCGQTIQAGKMDAQTGKLICPRCPRTKLMNRKVGDFTVDECPSCSGMWVDVSAFDRIVDQQVKRQDKEVHSAVGGGPLRSKIDPQDVVYLKCPVCRRHMHRRNFARASGVIIDECKNDGVWLDADELGKIAAFVATGGLAFARERQAMDTARAAHKIEHTPIPAMSRFPPIKGHETPLGTVLDVIRTFFSPM